MKKTMKIICLMLIVMYVVFPLDTYAIWRQVTINEGEAAALPHEGSGGTGVACTDTEKQCSKGWGVVLSLWYSDGRSDPYRIGTKQVLIYNSSLIAKVTRVVKAKGGAYLVDGQQTNGYVCKQISVPNNFKYNGKYDVSYVCRDTMEYLWSDVNYDLFANGKPAIAKQDNSLPNPTSGSLPSYLENSVTGIFSKTSSIGFAKSIQDINNNFAPKTQVNLSNMKYFYVSAEPVIRDIPEYPKSQILNEFSFGAVDATSSYVSTMKTNKPVGYKCEDGTRQIPETCYREVTVPHTTISSSACTPRKKAEGCWNNSQNKCVCITSATEIEPYIGEAIYDVVGYIYNRTIKVEANVGPIRRLCISTPYLLGLYNDGDEGTTRNKHCFRDDTTGQCIPNQYQWYIGPHASSAITLNKAINCNRAIASNLPSVCNSRGWSILPSDPTTIKNTFKCGGSASVWGDKSGHPRPVGISFYSATTCSAYCSNSDGSMKTGDALLKCAEEYCDNYIPFDEFDPKAKRACILEKCFYQPEYVPDDCTTTNPNDPVKNPDKATSPLNANSSCSINQRTDINIVNDPGVLNTCVSHDQYKIVTDRNGNKSYYPLTPLDMKKYHTISCVETTRAKFLDTSINTLVAGQGLNYFTNVYGNKECTVFFDTASWKLDYASIHSADNSYINTKPNDKTDVRRKRMVQLLNNFNNAANLEGIKDLDGNYVTRWEDLSYDTNAPVVRTVVHEIIEQKEVASRLYTLPKTYEKTNRSIKVIKTPSSKAYPISVININGKEISDFNVNTYVQDSKADLEYTIPAQCLTRNGLSQSYEALDEKCLAGDGRSRTVYYTNIKATPTEKITGNREHHVTTTVSINQASGNGSHADVNINEYCTYKIIGNSACVGNDCDLGCVIGVISDNSDETGTATYIGETEFELAIQDNGLSDSDYITGWDIKESTIELKPEIKEYTTKATLSGMNVCPPPYLTKVVTIKGVVTTKEGRRATCEKTVTLINMNKKTETTETDGGIVNNSQGTAQCKIVKKSATLFELQVTKGSAKKVNMWLSGESPRTIVKDANTNSYLLKTSTLANRYSVYGAVYDSNNCVSYCYYRGCNGDTCATPHQCIKEFAPPEYDKIRDYCAQNWNFDIAGYDSINDCTTSCSRGGWACRNINSCDPKVIKSACELNYKDWGYQTNEKISVTAAIANCTTDCNRWQGCTGRGVTYVYRPILIKNPFPKSYVDLTNPIGERIIGGNWIGKDGYITDDKDDPTNIILVPDAVNGELKEKKSTPEYEIVLTPAIIKEIKNASAAYDATTKKDDIKNVYLDWVYYKNDKNGTYVSNFIHSDDTVDDSKGFNKYFTYVAGVKIR